jgi:hypothetical protein
VRERALRIGKPTPLIGVSSEPEVFDPSLPALIVLNSGVMHHVGACRLSVKIARAAAAGGLLAVRFDYSGIGDSEPRRGSDAFEEVSLRECAEVMDYLQRTRGVERFILYGLCSGADAAYNTARADARVVAIAQIDAYCYITPRYYIEYYLPILFHGERWRSFLGRLWRRFTGRALPAPGPAPAEAQDDANFEIPTYTRIFPPRDAVADGLRALVARGVRLFVLFTGGEPHYNHLGQYRDSFRDVPFGDQLEVAYHPETNHIITQPDSQARIVRAIAGWALDVAGAAR